VTSILYQRTLDQNKLIGLAADDEVENSNDTELEGPSVWESSDALKNEVLRFDILCPNCQEPAETNMKVLTIPHFKDVVVMATNCSACGHRDSEVKASGGVAANGLKLTLSIERVEDLSRDVLKSETCSVSIPELEMEVGMAALNGRFTTVEGLLMAIKEQLSGDSVFSLGDSAVPESRNRMSEFLVLLDSIVSLQMKARLILDDPAGNSYIQSLGVDDNQLQIEAYVRNYEQNESLGLNDIKTENYEEQTPSAEPSSVALETQMGKISM